MMTNDETNKKANIKNIENLLKSANKIAKKKVESQKKNINCDRLDGLVSEFLGPYFLVGYDSKGMYVQLTRFNTQAELDSLKLSLERFTEIGFGFRNKEVSNFFDEDFGDDDDFDGQFTE